jgi:hypothetical protein
MLTRGTNKNSVDQIEPPTRWAMGLAGRVAHHTETRVSTINGVICQAGGAKAKSAHQPENPAFDNTREKNQTDRASVNATIIQYEIGSEAIFQLPRLTIFDLVAGHSVKARMAAIRSMPSTGIITTSDKAG